MTNEQERIDALNSVIESVENTPPPMICPICSLRPAMYGFKNIIGHRRERCRTCNAYNQRVLRLTAKRMREEYPEKYREIREKAERDVYAALNKTSPPRGVQE